MMCHKINYVKREALKIKASLFLFLQIGVDKC
jgi:hypothetical protein